MFNMLDHYWMLFCFGSIGFSCIALIWSQLNNYNRYKEEQLLAQRDHLLEEVVHLLEEVVHLLEEVVHFFETAPDNNKVMDAIYIFFDALLRAGNFEHVDLVLGKVDVSMVKVDFLLAILLVTYAAKSKLANYKKFYEAVNKHLLTVVNVETGETYTEEEALALLTGLSP